MRRLVSERTRRGDRSLYTSFVNPCSDFASEPQPFPSSYEQRFTSSLTSSSPPCPIPASPALVFGENHTGNPFSITPSTYPPPSFLHIALDTPDHLAVRSQSPLQSEETGCVILKNRKKREHCKSEDRSGRWEGVGGKVVDVAGGSRVGAIRNRRRRASR